MTTRYLVGREGNTWVVRKRTRRFWRTPRFVTLGVWSTIAAAADHAHRLGRGRWPW